MDNESFVTGEPGNRRRFLEETLGRVAEELAKRTERRVAPKLYFRPPGALDELPFLAACTRCSDCMDVCPVHAIVKAPPGAGFAVGTPMIDPIIQPCTVCDDMPCAAACPTDALNVPETLWEGYRLATLELVSERCIAFQGVQCGVCARACPVGDDALSLDDEGRPVIKIEGCVGCGVCVRACVTAPSSLELHLL
ncbi:MAG: 4Fe-4S dicluster domain-containing protein [Gemmatimonadales bacterium]